MGKREAAYQRKRIAYWDAIAVKMDHWQSWGTHYHHRIIHRLSHLIPPGARILEIGCGQGDLLAALDPTLGIGIDISSQMIIRARKKHPGLDFIIADANDLPLTGTFDYIIMSDLVNDLWDVQKTLEQVAKLCAPETRLILNVQSQLWHPLLAAAEKLNLARPLINQNWLTPNDLGNLLQLEHFDVIQTQSDILWPLGFRPLQILMNQIVVKYWPFKHFGLSNMLVARQRYGEPRQTVLPSVSVIVPARNESGNIRDLIESIPNMGRETEIVFVEGHSTDDTYARIEREIAAHPDKTCRLYRQNGKGKADAVRLGFEMSSGEICMIYDADRTVPPDQLPRFYDALVEGAGELVNGVRLVYPMEDRSMRFLNLVGNKFFSLAISWLLGQSIKDTLCGTKVLWRKDYARIRRALQEFGDFDPFGDFDLLFIGAKLGLKIVDLPIRYRERTYGQTNIHRWRHGAQLIKMLVIAATKIKFV